MNNEATQINLEIEYLKSLVVSYQEENNKIKKELKMLKDAYQKVLYNRKIKISEGEECI